MLRVGVGNDPRSHPGALGSFRRAPRGDGETVIERLFREDYKKFK
jgi:hypothetical protein